MLSYRFEFVNNEHGLFQFRKYYAKWKKSDTQSHVVYYFIYLKYPE